MNDNDKQWPTDIDPMELIENMKSNYQVSQDKKVLVAQHEYQLRINHPDRMNEFLEPYCLQDSWILYKEAMSLIQGLDPNFSKDLYQDHALQRVSIANQIKSSIGVTLQVVNPDKMEVEWRVRPREFIVWALSKKIEVIPELTEYFNLNKANQMPNNIEKTHKNSEINAQKREMVLEAALAVLAAYPEKCMINGNIKASKIADMIEQKSNLWFGYDEIPLKRRGVEDLIRKALKTTTTNNN